MPSTRQLLLNKTYRCSGQNKRGDDGGTRVQTTVVVPTTWISCTDEILLESLRFLIVEEAVRTAQAEAAPPSPLVMPTWNALRAGHVTALSVVVWAARERTVAGELLPWQPASTVSWRDLVGQRVDLDVSVTAGANRPLDIAYRGLTRIAGRA
jgi:hypothetical protein